MTTIYHPSHDDPQPRYPKHCPVCSATVHPLHWSMNVFGVATVKMPWTWTARCWNGHLVEALPAQLVLVEVA